MEQERQVVQAGGVVEVASPRTSLRIAMRLPCRSHGLASLASVIQLNHLSVEAVGLVQFLALLAQGRFRVGPLVLAENRRRFRSEEQEHEQDRRERSVDQAVAIQALDDDPLSFSSVEGVLVRAIMQGQLRPALQSRWRTIFDLC